MSISMLEFDKNVMPKQTDEAEQAASRARGHLDRAFGSLDYLRYALRHLRLFPRLRRQLRGRRAMTRPLDRRLG